MFSNVVILTMCLIVVPQVLLIGPGSGSDGRSEVLNLPDLTPLDCNIPVFPDREYHGYVGRSTSDGVLMCGGMTSSGYTSSSSCYLLTSSGYQDMQGLINKRRFATSVVTPLGLWVTGKPGVILLFIILFLFQEDWMMMDTITLLLLN